MTVSSHVTIDADYSNIAGLASRTQSWAVLASGGHDPSMFEAGKTTCSVYLLDRRQDEAALEQIDSVLDGLVATAWRGMKAAGANVIVGRFALESGAALWVVGDSAGDDNAEMVCDMLDQIGWLQAACAIDSLSVDDGRFIEQAGVELRVAVRDWQRDHSLSR
jgi:hypothetical protein